MNHSQLKTYFERILTKFPIEQRAQIWCDLNRYIWPGEFDNVKPDGWERLQRYDKDRLPIYLALWNEVVKVTPHKDCLRAWNAEMTDDEFEEYWAEINNEMNDQ